MLFVLPALIASCCHLTHLPAPRLQQQGKGGWLRENTGMIVALITFLVLFCLGPAVSARRVSLIFQTSLADWETATPSHLCLPLCVACSVQGQLLRLYRESASFEGGGGSKASLSALLQNVGSGGHEPDDGF